MAALAEAVAVAGKLDLWDKKIEKHTIKNDINSLFLNISSFIKEVTKERNKKKPHL